MTQSMAYITVQYAGKEHDLSVPIGTTVAGLLAMLKIDSSSSQHSFFLSPGIPAPLNAVIGSDIPSGAWFSITSNAASRQAEAESLRTATAHWSGRAIASTSLALLVLAVFLSASFLPFLGVTAPLSVLQRTFLAAPTAIVIIAAAMLEKRFSAATASSFTTALGLIALTMLPMGQAFTLAPLVFASTAFLVSLSLWIRQNTFVTSTLTKLWGGAVVFATTILAVDIPFSMAVIFTIPCALWGVTTAADRAVQIPDSQLIDLPLVTTISPSVRSAPKRPPARITLARIQRTITESHDTASVLIIWWSMVVFAALPVNAWAMGIDSMQGVAAIVLGFFAPLALLTVAKNCHTRELYLFPLIPGFLGLVIFFIAAAELVPFPILGFILPLAAMAMTLMSVVVSTSQPSALRGRITDILRSIGLLIVFPAAFVASGLFDLVRQVAS